jgi:hypothetical protein
MTLPDLAPPTKIDNKWNVYDTLGNNYNYTADHKNTLYHFDIALNLETK